MSLAEQAPPSGGPVAIYSGTAANDLRRLHADALTTISQINERTSGATQTITLARSAAWEPRSAAAWLNPLGAAEWPPRPPDDVVITGAGAVGTAVLQAFEYVDRLTGLDASQRFGRVKEAVYGGGTPTQVALGLVGHAVTLPDAASEAEEDQTPTTRAYSAFKELRGWLDATDDEIATMAGIGRTTVYAWRRGHEPRPSTVRVLYQAHALVSALVDRLEEDRAKRWLHTGDPSPRGRLLASDLASVQSDARPLLFPGQRPRVRPGSWQPPEADAAASADEA